jgi:hypothetical protein
MMIKYDQTTRRYWRSDGMVEDESQTVTDQHSKLFSWIPGYSQGTDQYLFYLSSKYDPGRSQQDYIHRNMMRIFGNNAYENIFKVVDHIDGNPRNNNINNLRPVDMQLNAVNRPNRVWDTTWEKVNGTRYSRKVQLDHWQCRLLLGESWVGGRGMNRKRAFYVDDPWLDNYLPINFDRTRNHPHTEAGKLTALAQDKVFRPALFNWLYDKKVSDEENKRRAHTPLHRHLKRKASALSVMDDT